MYRQPNGRLSERLEVKEMNNIKFTWNMTKKDYKRLQKDLSSKRWIGNNVYGGFGAGRLFIGISTMSYGELIGDDESREDENILTEYTFLAGGDSGYGEFPDKTPYDLLSDGLNMENINTKGSFEEFKVSFEIEVMRAANEEACCKDWNKYLASNKYADTVNKYWYKVA